MQNVIHTQILCACVYMASSAERENAIFAQVSQDTCSHTSSPLANTLRIRRQLLNDGDAR